MPIPEAQPYSLSMKTTTRPPQKTLRFSIEAEAALSTLESALAIVRRIGITLDGLRISPCADGMDVWMRLQAGEEDMLTLCRMRLHNAVGVLAIREFPAPQGLPVAPAESDAAGLDYCLKVG